MNVLIFFVALSRLRRCSSRHFWRTLSKYTQVPLSAQEGQSETLMHHEKVHTTLPEPTGTERVCQLTPHVEISIMEMVCISRLEYWIEWTTNDWNHKGWLTDAEHAWTALNCTEILQRAAPNFSCLMYRPSALPLILPLTHSTCKFGLTTRKMLRYNSQIKSWIKL